MLKHIVKPIVFLCMVVLIILGMVLMIFKCVNRINQFQTTIEQAKVAVVEQAKEQLGRETNVVFEKIDSKNDLCWIGCVNSQNTHAIMYIAKLNKHTETWEVDVFSESEGADAARLFYAKHSIG